LRDDVERLGLAAGNEGVYDLEGLGIEGDSQMVEPGEYDVLSP